MQCHHHPNAAAIENCANCDVPMCGMCATFTDTEVLCEKCVEIREAEKFVAVQSEQLERPTETLQVDADVEEDFETASKPLLSPQAIQVMIIVTCIIIVGVRLAFFGGEQQVRQATDEERAREFAITSFASCLIVFRQIGEVLATGGLPPDTMLCADSSTPNIVTRSGQDVRIDHPNPGFYNVSEIYVTRSNPEPSIVD